MRGETKIDGVEHAVSVKRYTKALRLGSNVPLGIAISAIALLALAFGVNLLNIPNPNMILVTGLVVCATFFGPAGGAVAALVMIGYTLFFFSTGNDFVTFTDENMQKVIVTLVGVVTIGFFVSVLRFIVGRSMIALEQLNELLEENNRQLEASAVGDSLTGTLNRFGLRRDFPNYVKRELHVAMIDVDDFKGVNDTYGHQAGDQILKQMGSELVGLFGAERVYRYGGDEFLVASTDIPEADFKRKMGELMEQFSEMSARETDAPVHFSAGYAFGTPASENELRLMIKQADANLYSSKHAGKNRVIGDEFKSAGAA